MIICTICARGGSKGVPGKNIRTLAGKPLIAHTIAQAKETGIFSTIAVSSDSDEILAVAMQYGADICIKRPYDLASDDASKLPAIHHALLAAEAELGAQCEAFVDLDATSPLRIVSDIVGAVALLNKTNCNNVITAAPARRSPYFNLVETDENGTVYLSKPLPKSVVRRQDSPNCYDMNASIYVWQRDAFVKKQAVFYDNTQLFEMPENRSQDIDSELDFKIVELLMQERKHEQV